MKPAALLNVVLWCTNILLIVGIFVYVYIYFVNPSSGPKVDLVNLKKGSGGGYGGGGGYRPPNYAAIAKVPNPITKEDTVIDPVDHGPSAFQATLVGTFPPDFVFLKVANDEETLAEIGKKILVKEAEVLRGWRLVECYTDHAVFTDGRRRETLKLTIPTIGAGGPIGSGMNRKGQNYDPKNFNTRKIHSSASREVWLMDPNEIQWAMQNFESEMESKVTVSPTSNGLRITSINSGSIGISRGLKTNDVLRSVNGHAMKSLADIKKMQNDPRNQRRRSMTLIVQRSGRNVVLEYRTASKSEDR